MRALAEYAMRGRREAVLAAVAGAAIPMFFWVSAAIVCLVTLRRGARDGVTVAMWAALPALGQALFLGDITPVAALISAVMAALLLRYTASWPWTLCALVTLGLAMSAGLQLGAGEYLAGVEKALAALVDGLVRQAHDPVAAGKVLRAPTSIEIAGSFGLTQCVVLVASLVLARWWQAQLYNPGGLRVEMYALRLRAAQVIGLLGAAFLLAQLGPGFRVWAMMPLVPLLVAGTGLVHALFAARAWSGWLGLFYLALLLMPALLQLPVALAVMDGLLDLRRRLLPPRNGDDDKV